MFLGTHEPKLDEKGRLILPARFRDELADGLVITKGQEHCLYVFPASEFALITERLRQAPVTQKNSGRQLHNQQTSPQSLRCKMFPARYSDTHRYELLPTLYELRDLVGIHGSRY